MKCPKCKKQIEYAIVINECRQEGYFKEGTNQISRLEDINHDDIAQYMSEITAIVRIVCPECDEIITKHIKQ